MPIEGQICQGTAHERERLAQKAKRIPPLYIEVELDDAEYRRQRANVVEALAAIPPDELPTPEAVGKRLAALLADLSIAWAVATPEERNRIARQLFADVVIDNRTAVAMKPRPELAPFFASLTYQPDSSITSERKRRGDGQSDTLSGGHDLAGSPPG